VVELTLSFAHLRKAEYAEQLVAALLKRKPASTSDAARLLGPSADVDIVFA